MVLRLPPTPEELQVARLVRRSLSVIEETTTEILATVAANAFGFSEGAARRLTLIIEETAVLCRSCEHSLAQTQSRAATAAAAVGCVAAVDEERQLLTTEVTKATRTFADVSAAARSAMSQVGDSDEVTAERCRQRKQKRANWEQLYALQPEAASAEAATATAGEPSSSEAEPAAAPAVPASSSFEARAPLSPSSALSLWQNREPDVFDSPPGALEARAAALGEVGAFTEVDRVHAKHMGRGGGGSGGRGGGRRGGGAPRPAELARKLRAELQRLQALTAELEQLMQQCVWGFSDEAVQRLEQLVASARGAARECRRLLPPPADTSERTARAAEVESAIAAFGTLVEAAHSALAQTGGAPTAAVPFDAAADADADADEAVGLEPSGAWQDWIEESSRHQAAQAALDESAAKLNAAPVAPAKGGSTRAAAAEPASPPGPRSLTDAAQQQQQQQQQQQVAGGAAPQQQQQVQVQVQQQRAWEGSAVQQNATLINENNSAIEKISREVHELCELFEGIGELVEVQSRPIENIQIAAEAGVARTQMAVEELQLADKNKQDCVVM